MTYPKVSNLPSVNTTQMIEVDRRMIEDIGISLFQMMENAGLQLANVARDMFLGRDIAGKRIAILAGSGGNGGGAIVAARRLTNWGAKCDLGLSRTSSDLAKIPQKQLDIFSKINPISFIEPEALNSEYDMIIDGLIGYSLIGAPRGRTAEFIMASNSTETSVLSLDVPSGFDSSSGRASELCVQADITMTLALPKIGMINNNNLTQTGRLFCADIGCPNVVFENLDLDERYRTPFSKGPVIELVSKQ